MTNRNLDKCNQQKKMQRKSIDTLEEMWYNSHKISGGVPRMRGLVI